MERGKPDYLMSKWSSSGFVSPSEPGSCARPLDTPMMRSPKMLFLLGRLWMLVVPVHALAREPRVLLDFERGSVLITLPPRTYLLKEFTDVALAQRSGSISVGPLPLETAVNAQCEAVYSGEVRIPVSGEGLRGRVQLRVHVALSGEGAGNVAPEWMALTVDAAMIPVVRPTPGNPASAPDQGSRPPPATQKPVHPNGLQGRTAHWAAQVTLRNPALGSTLGVFLVWLAGIVDVFLDAAETLGFTVLLSGVALVLYRVFTGAGAGPGRRAWR